ncbi:MAG: hypothetical protein ACJATI_005284 [Halioglobus sp.]|jgi:hypothetical protein
MRNQLIILLLLIAGQTMHGQITKNHINLLGSDIYMEITEPYNRAPQGPIIIFPNIGIELTYLQVPNDSLCKQTAVNVAMDDATITEYQIDNYTATRSTVIMNHFEDEVSWLTFDQFYFSKGSVCTYLKFQIKGTKGKEFQDDLLKTTKIDFNHQVDYSEHLSFNHQLVDWMAVYGENQIAGMLLISKKGHEPFKTTTLMFNDNTRIPDIVLSEAQEKINDRDLETTILIENNQTQILLKSSPSPKPSFKAYELMLLDDRFMIMGAVIYETDEEFEDIKQYLKSIKKKR